MPNATRLLISFAGAAFLAACGRDDSEQNIVITNEIPANADIEALPADESATTPSDELANGSASPSDDTENTDSNAY